MKDLLHQNVSSFIISPFTKNEAIIVQLIFTYSFFEFVFYGGMKEFHVADKLGPNITYFFEPSAFLAIALSISYVLFLTIIVAGAYQPSERMKKYIALVMVGIATLVSLLSASDIVRATPKDNLYEIATYCIALVVLLFSGTRLIVIFSTVSRRYDEWGTLNDKEITNKMKSSYMSLTIYIFVTLSSCALYFFIHPPFMNNLSQQTSSIGYTFSQTYFSMMIITLIYEKLLARLRA